MQTKESRIKQAYEKLYKKDIEHLSYPLHEYDKFIWYIKHQEYTGSQTNILDLGCGTGKLLVAIAKYYHKINFKNIHFFGNDISITALEVADKVLDKIFWRSKSRYKLYNISMEDFTSLGRKYEYIFSLGSLEHALDIGKVLDSCMFMLSKKEHARVILMVPNKDFIYWKVFNPGTHQRDVNETLHSVKKWGTIFAEHGLTIERIDKDLALASRAPKFFQPLVRLALRLIPLKYTYQPIFVLKRSEKHAKPKEMGKGSSRAK